MESTALPRKHEVLQHQGLKDQGSDFFPGRRAVNACGFAQSCRNTTVTKLAAPLMLGSLQSFPRVKRKAMKELQNETFPFGKTGRQMRLLTSSQFILFLGDLWGEMGSGTH